MFYLTLQVSPILGAVITCLGAVFVIVCNVYDLVTNGQRRKGFTFTLKYFGDVFFVSPSIIYYFGLVLEDDVEKNSGKWIPILVLMGICHTVNIFHAIVFFRILVFKHGLYCQVLDFVRMLLLQRLPGASIPALRLNPKQIFQTEMYKVAQKNSEKALITFIKASGTYVRRVGEQIAKLKRHRKEKKPFLEQRVLLDDQQSTEDEEDAESDEVLFVSESSSSRRRRPFRGELESDIQQVLEGEQEEEGEGEEQRFADETHPESFLQMAPPEVHKGHIVKAQLRRIFYKLVDDFFTPLYVGYWESVVDVLYMSLYLSNMLWQILFIAIAGLRVAQDFRRDHIYIDAMIMSSIILGMFVLYCAALILARYSDLVAYDRLSHGVFIETMMLTVSVAVFLDVALRGEIKYDPFSLVVFLLIAIGTGARVLLWATFEGMADASESFLKSVMLKQNTVVMSNPLRARLRKGVTKNSP